MRQIQQRTDLMNLSEVVSVKNMRESDAHTIAEHTTSAELMHRAAHGIFDAAQFRGKVAIVCGKGNNGGDGLVMARAAAQDGWRVAVLLAEGDPKTPDAMTNYARLADLPVTKCRDAAALAAQPFDAVVDALYGTGFHGSLRPAGLAACALMNRQRESGAFVLAVDLPSGINTDTGEAAEGAVRADLTVTFDSCKPLHTAPSSAPFCGEIVCADIGIRDEWHPAGLAQL